MPTSGRPLPSSCRSNGRARSPDHQRTPFGPWLAASPKFIVERAKTSVQIHEDGLEALQALKVPIVISSRPVIAGGRSANEAFILEHGCFRFLHQKQFFFLLKKAGSNQSGSEWRWV